MNRRSICRTAASVTVVLVLVLVPAALAGKGGNGGRPGGGASTTATLVASCGPCVAGSYASFSGSGYDGSQGAAQLYVSGAWTAIPVAADGTVSFTWYMLATGPYDFRVYQRGKGQKLALKAQLTVTAQ